MKIKLHEILKSKKIGLDYPADKTTNHNTDLNTGEQLQNAVNSASPAPQLSMQADMFRHLKRTTLVLVVLMICSGGIKYLLGYCYGILIGILLFLHTLSYYKKLLAKESARPKRRVMSKFALHYLIYGLTLYGAWKNVYISFTGAVFGLLTMKIGLFSWAMLRSFDPLYKSWLNKFAGRYHFNSSRK